MNEKVKLFPFKKRFVVIHANGDDLIDTDILQNRAIIYLSLLKPNKNEIKIPLTEWFKTTIYVSHESR